MSSSASSTPRSGVSGHFERYGLELVEEPPWRIEDRVLERRESSVPRLTRSERFTAAGLGVVMLVYLVGIGLCVSWAFDWLFGG